MSPTFKKERGYTFKIYSNEEERIHIHVMKDDDEAKFWLEPHIELAQNYGFSSQEINEISKIIESYANDFREKYKQHIGKRVDD